MEEEEERVEGCRGLVGREEGCHGVGLLAGLKEKKGRRRGEDGRMGG